MRIIATFVLLAGVWAAHAQAAPTAPAPVRGILHELERLAAGKPLPVVVVPPLNRFSASRPLPALDFKGKPLLTCLQDIGDACTWKRGDEKQMPSYVAAYFKGRFPLWIPFKFHGVWTIAPEVRDDLKPNVGNVEPLMAMQEWTALQTLVHSLTRDQMRQATTIGIRYSDVTVAQQAVMRATFGRPIGLMSSDPKRPGWVQGFDGHLPVEQCTLHVCLSYYDVRWEEGGMTLLMKKSVEPMYLQDGDGPGGIGLPLKTRVPNALRQQDLAFDASALSKPIGVKGITTVGKVVAAAAKATGVSLKVVHGWADSPVFVGDAGMRTGDALRVVAFELQGAWRKVGRTYLLAWDRTGLGADNLDLSEKLGSIKSAVDDTQKSLERDDWNENALSTLTQDPDLPIGPTFEQTAEIRRRAMATHDYRASLSFSELTPEQQNALVAAVAGATRYPDRQPITRELLATAKLGQPEVHTALDVPGVGAVDLGPLGSIRIEFDPMLVPRRQPEPAPVEDDRPILLPPGVHGVAPPPIGRASWARLLAQMKRKGLDALYLPVFWDGQTLFPSKQFPLLPIARGHDVLNEVLAVAKQDRIRVIAVVHGIAWRFPGSKVHWLTKRRDLVDVDALRRGRWDWASMHAIPQKEDSFGDPLSTIAYDPQLLSDFVHPNDPEVKRRLLGLVTELRAYKGLDGVALAHWSRLAGRCYDIDREFESPEGPPALGFGLADRTWFLSIHGEDPVDIMDRDAWFRPPYSEADSFDAPWCKYRFAQDAALANAVIEEMEKGWPGHVQTFSYLSRLDEGKMPAADIAVRDNEPDATDKALLRRVTAPAFLDPKDSPKDEAEIRAARIADFTEGITLAAKEAEGPRRKSPLRGVVLDLTASPDLIWDALDVLPNRSGAPATVSPTRQQTKSP